MNISVARINRLPENGPIKAFVDLSIDDVLLIKSFRIVEGPQGLFVTMPQKRGKNDRWYNSIYCLTPEFKQRMVEKILDVYHQKDTEEIS